MNSQEDSVLMGNCSIHHDEEIWRMNVVCALHLIWRQLQDVGGCTNEMCTVQARSSRTVVRQMGTLKTARLRAATSNHRASGIFTCEDGPRNKVSHGPRGGILSGLALCLRAVVKDSDVSPANRMSTFTNTGYGGYIPPMSAKPENHPGNPNRR